MVLATSCSGPSPESHAACRAPAPISGLDVSGASRGTVSPVGKLEPTAVVPGAAYRDSSVLVIGYCVPENDLITPDLIRGHRRISAFGGTLVQRTSERPFQYVLYPPARGRRFDILHGKVLLGRVTFPPASKQICPLKARRPFVVVACGSIVLVEWMSPFKLDPRNLGTIALEVRDPEAGVTNLGFFLVGVRERGGRLAVRFGFRPPTGERLMVRVLELTRLRGSDEIAIPRANRFSTELRLTTRTAD